MHPDTLIRIACCTWLSAPDSGLSPAQHAWLRTRLQSRTPLTPQERARLQAPLVLWCRRHGMGDQVAAQFEAREPLREKT